MFFELVLRARMGERSPRQIGRALADGQIHPFNERRVQCRRVLGVVEPFCEPPRCGHQLSSFDLNDAIVSSRLEHLAVESRGTKDATDDLLVEIESVGDDQGKTLDIHAVRDVAQKSERVSVASSSGHRRRPEPRPHLDGDEDPRWPRLAADEGANFIGLELLDDEAGQPASRLWLKRRHISDACSSHRATVFQAIPSTRAIAEMLTPSTLRATTASNRALRCWRR